MKREALNKRLPQADAYRIPYTSANWAPPCGWTDGDGQRRKPVDHLAAGPARRSALACAKPRYRQPSQRDGIIYDDPALTVRWAGECLYAGVLPAGKSAPAGAGIIDSQNRVTPAHRIVQQHGETWIARTREDSPRGPMRFVLSACRHYNGHLDLVVLMMQLRQAAD